MKYWLILVAFSLGPFSFGQAQQAQIMEIAGYPGEVIRSCIDKRTMGQDVGHLVEPFTHKDETWCWQSEFWGKWMLSAVAAYRYNQDDALMENMHGAVQGLLATQMPDGHIGNYGPDQQLTG